ncbi:Neurotransmitter-gated ion-channel ligand-binding domain-containing protein [Caenorhabditis elegans]|uniref:Neurotransmitter-gated ion-channel ligand-binding domain-containing protein n=2 Tax=Caenorhabditis elegans TaxID=6239 RepID=Q9NAM5_CAEEL|nr:Neurotransmitter-gated ion-channel ligand-binding domain-containing protein [Caenorhabditis elegans]CAB54361.2 Neurotransmitter-gated ion-channel ligand-binding domain-containing protein [Caenorhabditis elegans]|eukprot:NP_502905.2 Ligand-Gated ion Channel [Caenorhabditis elegans]
MILAIFSAIFMPIDSFFFDPELYVPKYKDFLDVQRNLTKHIFRDYDPTVSPVYTWVDVDLPIGYDNEAPKRYNYTIFLYYLKLVEVQEPQEKISVVMEIMEYWYDARLSWNASAWQNTTMIYMKQDKVWSPTISVFGVNDIVDFRDNDNRLICIENTGFIWDYVSVRVSANCEMDVSRFPFDTQICQIRFCLPIFYRVQVDILNEIYEEIMDERIFKTMGNSEWKLLNLTNRVEALVYNDNMGTMDLAIFEITIRRNPLYYIYMIVFPSFIINFVSIVGVFLNGADKMSRLNVGLTNIMTMTFILGVMADKIPRTGNIPLLGIYIIINLVIMLIAIAIVTAITELRKWASPKLRKKKTALRAQLESFLGRPLEYTSAIILELMTCANFLVMVGFWFEDDS